MKALVHTEPFRFTYTDVPEPEIGPDEVLVRIRAVGICGSDVHGYTGRTGRRIPPIIMGHEAAGIVERVGTNVSEIAPGERVCFDSTVYCNDCPACREGRHNRCERRQVLGVSIPGMKRQGAMAEYVVLPSWTLIRMPENLTFIEAALLEPVSIGVHAVNRAGIREGENVLVIGAGTIGLFVLQAARLAGAGRIVVSDPSASRRALAQKLGADAVVDPQSTDPVDAVRDIGIDVAFEVVGFAATLHQAIAATRMGGRVVLVGNLTKHVEIDVQSLISSEISLIGSYASSGEYRDCVDLVASGKIDVRPLVTEIVPLSEGQRAFDRLHDNREELLKIVLEP